MNRWWGTAEDSKVQKSERDQRAAKKYIRNLPTVATSPTSDEELDFADAETSFSAGLNVDGETTDEVADTPQVAAAMQNPPPPNVLFEDENKEDDSEAAEDAQLQELVEQFHQNASAETSYN